METSSNVQTRTETLVQTLALRARWWTGVVACRLSACVVATVAFLVLIGWSIGSVHMKSIFPGFVAMNPATAVLFLLCACSLGLVASIRLPSFATKLGPGLGLGIACFALLKISDATFGTEFGVDQILFRAALQLEGWAPNRMAPNTAVNFVLLGLALGTFRHPGRVAMAAPVLVLLVALVSYLALLGYAYEAVSFARVSSFIPMALHTACCFLVLCNGLLMVTPDRGLLGILVRKSGGGRLLRWLIPVMLGVPPMLGWLRLSCERAGLFGQATGVTLMVAVMVVMGLGLGLWNALGVDARERDRLVSTEAIRRLAHYDDLTGLPNRALFFDRLNHALAQEVRHGRHLAVLYLDLDRFKSINDTLGHGVGDKVLAEAAHRLHSCVRDTDTVARLGGDEFTAILTEYSDADSVRIITERILSVLACPFHIDGHEVHVSASIGVALSVIDGRKAEELLQRADEALYRAKVKRNHCEFYSESRLVS